MSWLATGVWLGLQLQPPTVHPDTITENKIQVFRKDNPFWSPILKCCTFVFYFYFFNSYFLLLNLTKF